MNLNPSLVRYVSYSSNESKDNFFLHPDSFSKLKLLKLKLKLDVGVMGSIFDPETGVRSTFFPSNDLILDLLAALFFLEYGLGFPSSIFGRDLQLFTVFSIPF